LPFTNIDLNKTLQMPMRVLIFLLISLLSSNSTGWLLDFEKAKQSAQNEHKYILLYFSGSDWCGPCIQMRLDIFNTNKFEQYATQHLVLVNADFPRSKKNSLSRDQQKKNDHLAEIYNKKGIFPLTVLLTAEGKPLKYWEGNPKLSVDQFVKQIQSITNAGK
jgi:thioredoxin-related protein